MSQDKFRFYILNDDKTVSGTNDVDSWSKHLEGKGRFIKQETINKSIWISTVFLGIDHSWGNGPPILFETMVFKDPCMDSVTQERYYTYEEAIEGHNRIVEQFTERDL